MSTIDTPSNIILDSLNRIHYGKLTGGLSSTELSEEIIRIGDLISNNIRNGKISDYEVLKETINGHIPNKNYFRFPHKDLEVASKTVSESLEMSISEREERFQKVR